MHWYPRELATAVFVAAAVALPSRSDDQHFSLGVRGKKNVEQDSKQTIAFS